MGGGPHHRSMLSVLFHIQEGACGICRKPMDNSRGAHRRECPSRATVDHVIPTRRGGFNGRGNLFAAHARCNNAKADCWPTAEELAFLSHINALLGWPDRALAA